MFKILEANNLTSNIIQMIIQMNMLKENREILDRISEFLFEKETITGKEFMKMFREMKGIPEPEETSSKEEDDDEHIFAEN